MGRQLGVMSLLMDGSVGLEELTGCPARPVRSGWQMAQPSHWVPGELWKQPLGPLPQPRRRTFINLGGGCMGRYPGLQRKTARGKAVDGENVRGRGDPEYVMFSMQPALSPSPPSEGTDYFLLCACPASPYLFDYPWGWFVT